MAHLNPTAADNVHYSTDPRIRHLAEAAWRMRTGGNRMDWLCLGKDNPEALIREAREWVRAAVASGIIPAPSSDPEWKSAAHTAANADDTQHDEAEAAATFARECTDHAAVILWCADRVRWVDNNQAVRDAADYLHDLSTRAQVDATPVTDRIAVIRWCAQQVHSMGGDYSVEKAAEYLEDLATEAEGTA
ncbi:hypothetical protein QFZ63_001502 [Streptomyces sp. B3I7]|uniref:hypothetical protein n=1 Tax=Streptomyces sp. B3I7 TaxID=3042269 RepID=UPI002788377D|nr:hypothetical protein [Streptomyces sp. B3I7]MDQ0809788.1 hypothetical protein [Streptomyces sp. B3I7]